MTPQFSYLTTSQREAIFGKFAWKPNGDSAITITDGWDDHNITTVNIPQLKGVPTYGGKCSGNIHIHRRCAAQLQGAWADIERLGLLDKVLFWDGSYVPRRVRGSQSLSPHSWGIAFDINATWNPYKHAAAADGLKGSVVSLVPVLHAWGFYWGGWWNSSKDGMHFEVAKPDLTAPLWKVGGDIVAPALKVVLLPGSEVIECRPVIEDGILRGDLRPFTDALGAEMIADHIADQGKVYIHPRTTDKPI